MANPKQPEKKPPVFSKRNFHLAIYIVLIVLVCTCIAKVIWNWSSTISILKAFFSAVSPVIIGFLLALVLMPAVSFFDRKVYKKFFYVKKERTRKILGLLTSYVIILGVVIVTIIYLIPRLIESIGDLAVSIQNFGPTVISWGDTLQKKFPGLDLKQLEEAVTKALPSISTMIQTIATSVFSKIYGVGVSIISWILNILIAIMVSCYLILDWNRVRYGFRRHIYAIMSQKRALIVLKTCKDCTSIFTNFVVGKTVDSLIIGCLCFIITSLLQLKYALIISLVVGLTNMIPYFGPFIGAVPGVLIQLMVSWKAAVIFFVVIIVLQQFDGLFLGPKILGNSTGLRPVWIIFGITLGGWIAGPLGMFLGVPFVAICSYILEGMTDISLKKKGIILPRRSGIHTNTNFGENLRGKKPKKPEKQRMKKKTNKEKKE